MSTALFVPLTQSAADARTRSDALRRALEPVLQQVLDATSLLGLHVVSPLLVGGPVVVERMAGAPYQGLAVVPSGSLSITVSPIPAGPHTPEGALWVTSSHPDALAESRAVPGLVSAIMDSEMARMVAEGAARGALEIANRDPATGLGNRRAWMQALKVEAGRARRTQRPFTLIVLDIDGLKAVNDSQGHAAGDALIARAAMVLETTRRATDVVCRLGGDEFGIVAPDIDELQSELLCGRLRRCLQEQGVRVSLGMATSRDGADMVDDLWQQADGSMYADKRARR